MESDRKDLAVFKEIAQWSKENFGDQSGDGLVLGRVAPLLGMVEELGEAGRSEGYWETVDALADYLVFLVDYSSRSGLSSQECLDIFSSPIDFSATGVFSIGLRELYCVTSSLCHCELKRVQGIRGFSDDNVYREVQKKLLSSAVDMVGRLLHVLNHDASPLDLLNFVWSEVRKRNWKASPETGIVEQAEECNGDVHPAVS